jgi:2-polyprenyl-3-methyl-5-hydroxy-6-metoxy-1,4-benzoquinol methylase
LASLRGLVGGHQTWLQSASDRFDEVAGDLARRVPGAIALDGTDAFSLERFDAGLGGDVVGFRAAAGDAEQQLYLRYQDFFRGTEELIRQRHVAYLPLLRKRGPVLDVGCGRGEMLELLREHDIRAEGIDVDAAMVERCRAKGLAATVADAVEYVESAPAGSVGAVFAAQVIEHLPYPALVRFLRGAQRRCDQADG